MKRLGSKSAAFAMIWSLTAAQLFGLRVSVEASFMSSPVDQCSATI
jgi:hypothetical protein